MVGIVADAREIMLFLFVERALHVFTRADDFIFNPKLDVIHFHELFRPNLHAFRAYVIIGGLRAAFCLRAVVNNDMIGVKLETLARQIIFAGFAVSVAHGAGFRAVVVNGFVAVKRDARRTGHELQDVRFVLDADASS